MTEKLRKILSDAANGNSDLWKETEVAARILLAGGYSGHSEDLACLEGIEDCIELENLLSRGTWYFQETDKWKEEGGIKMVKGNAQEGFKKWFEAWEIEIREDWKATEEDGSWSAYENFCRNWEQNYKEWCVMGDWEQVENFKKEIRKKVDSLVVVLYDEIPENFREETNLCPECSFFCEQRFIDGQCK